MKKIVFFKIGGFSNINESLIAQFRQPFSEHSVVVVDVLKDILDRSPKRTSLLIQSLARYWDRILTYRQNPRDFFIRFEDAWEIIQTWCAQNIDPKETLFTFQTQSLFDASHPHVPQFIYTDHNYLANMRYPTRANGLKVSERWTEFERQFYHRAKVNFTTSEFAAQSLIEDYGVPANRAECVGSGVNVSMPSSPKQFSRKLRRILFIGVDWERKGGPTLLKAFLEVRRHLPDAELWIVGCSPSIQMKGVEIVGRIPSEEIPPYYSQADIFCLPSKCEPSATVLAEAATYELPVVATSVGGSTERVIHEKTGLLVPPDNPAALSEALLHILKDPDRARAYGMNGLEMAKNHFTWESVMAKIHSRIMKEIDIHVPVA